MYTLAYKWARCLLEEMQYTIYHRQLESTTVDTKYNEPACNEFRGITNFQPRPHLSVHKTDLL